MSDLVFVRHAPSMRQLREYVKAGELRDAITHAPDSEASLAWEAQSLFEAGELMLEADTVRSDWNVGHQIDSAREYWNEFGFGGSPDILLCSPYKRARETCAGLTPKTPEIVDALREREQGDFEFLDMHEWQQRLPEALDHWRADQFFHGPRNGESLSDVADRVEEALLNLPLKDAFAFCVAHEGLMWSARYKIEGLNPHEIVELRAKHGPDKIIKNCSILAYTSELPPGAIVREPTIKRVPQEPFCDLYKYVAVATPAQTPRSEWRPFVWEALAA